MCSVFRRAGSRRGEDVSRRIAGKRICHRTLAKAFSGWPHPWLVNGSIRIELRPDGAGFDAFDKESAGPFGLGLLGQGFPRCEKIARRTSFAGTFNDTRDFGAISGTNPPIMRRGWPIRR